MPETPAANDALERALERLRHRDRSASDIDAHLRAQGFSDEERMRALQTLARTGLTDDRRFALARADALIARGAGNLLVEHDLERSGVAGDVIADVLEALAPELERARAIVSRRGSTPRTARYLAAKGFARDAIAEAVAATEADELG